MKNATTPCQTLSLVLALFILMGLGQAIAGPNKINYQGKATDAAGNPLPDGDYAFTFRLFEVPTAGYELWMESATVHTAGGLFTHIVGSINPIPNWLFTNKDSLFLDVSIGPEHISPRTPLTSAGYAIGVNTIDKAHGGDIYGDINVRNSTTSEIAARIEHGTGGAGRLFLNKTDGTVGISLYGANLGSAAVQFPAGAIQATEILDEPGVGSDNNTGITLTGGVQFLAGRTMTAPVDGYVLVIATASVNLHHSNGTRTTCAFGVSDNITQWVESAVGYLDLPSSLPTGTYEFPVASHALFPITAGSHPYYALGAGTSAVAVYNVQLTECFFPTAYTTVSLPVPSTGSTPESAKPFDPEAERLEAQAFYKAKVQAELDKIQAELEAVKQEMSDLKNSNETRR